MTDSIYVRKDPEELKWPFLLRRDDDGQLSLLLWVDSKNVAVFSFTRPDSPDRWNAYTVRLDKERMQCVQTCLDIFWASSILDRYSPKHKVLRLAVSRFSSDAVGGMMQIRKVEASIRSRHESFWSNNDRNLVEYLAKELKYWYFRMYHELQEWYPSLDTTWSTYIGWFFVPHEPPPTCPLPIE